MNAPRRAALETGCVQKVESTERYNARATDAFCVGASFFQEAQENVAHIFTHASHEIYKYF